MPKGTKSEGVERYPSGQIKYERNLKEEYKKYKEARVLVGVKITPELAKKFNIKLGIEGTTKNAKIKSWIDDYVNGKLK